VCAPTNSRQSVIHEPLKNESYFEDMEFVSLIFIFILQCAFMMSLAMMIIIYARVLALLQLCDERSK
jgi:hypothetical protein